ncbi:hypothetical protein BSKO_09836 [Bryopsis sp. KO-2023]|nr:hypothetical protein BSKO_09836 [Bryopsis sp. KO-2023]
MMVCVSEGLAMDDQPNTVASLGDWFWETTFASLSLSERAHAELVCKRWYFTLRSPHLWIKLSVAGDSVISQKCDTSMLGHLVASSIGATLRSDGDAGHSFTLPHLFRSLEWIPPPSPIKEIDLADCTFRGLSLLGILDTLAACPSLEILKMTGIKSSLTSTDLAFHSKDFEHIQEMVSEFGTNLKILEIDVCIQSAWTSYVQAKFLDPCCWDCFLEWMSSTGSPVQVKSVIVADLLEYNWAEVQDDGQILVEVLDPVGECIRDLGNALSVNGTVNTICFGPDCQLGDEGAALFLESIKGNTHLRELSIVGNGITTDGARNIASILLRYGPSIAALDLCSNLIDPVDSALLQHINELKHGQNFHIH